MPFKPVILTTDFLIYALVLLCILFALWARRKQHLREPWRRILKNKTGLCACMILCAYTVTGLLDSIHFRLSQPALQMQTEIHYSTQVKSLLDLILHPWDEISEKTYSAPFATHLYTKETIESADGSFTRAYPRLQYAGKNLIHFQRSQWEDVSLIALRGVSQALFLWAGISLLYIYFLKRRQRLGFVPMLKRVLGGNTEIDHRFIICVLAALLLIILTALNLSAEYHILGTDKVGQDTFYEAVKSIRTGLLIGTLTTLVMLPFSLLLGMSAGYWGGLTDDVIQYVYTTLSSIPGVLLIAASILSIQIFISNHPDLFPTIAQRADARLLALCVILGITSWTSLCRLLRGETLKLREMDYIQAARALGVRHLTIIARHVLPNLMHIVIITIVLDFSGLVLAEAVLSYVGVGVDPTTLSWGNMINGARLELAREPVVWWPLFSAFIFMFVLVLCANLFSDAVRDAFDPRTRVR